MNLFFLSALSSTSSFHQSPLFLSSLPVTSPPIHSCPKAQPHQSIYSNNFSSASSRTLALIALLKFHIKICSIATSAVQSIMRIQNSSGSPQDGVKGLGSNSITFWAFVRMESGGHGVVGAMVFWFCLLDMVGSFFFLW